MRRSSRAAPCASRTEVVIGSAESASTDLGAGAADDAASIDPAADFAWRDPPARLGLIGPIAQSLGLAPQAAGLIVTMSQIGYGAGLMFIVPLGDLIENRKLVLASVALSAIALAAAAFAPSAAVFLICAGAIGLGSVAVQILVPLAAHLAPDATRGRVVGMVSSGLMIGIMLARPVSSFIAAQSSWRVVFIASAAMMVALAAVLARALPVRAPNARMTYGALIASMAHLAAATPILRRRAFYQACLFFAFSLF
jgi:predicted MFS family arabinose efflux permease